MRTAAVLAASILALSAMLWAAEDAVVAPQQGATAAPITKNVVSSTDAITIPQILSYQGRLTDATGVPVRDGNYRVAFKLYTAPAGGSPFWNETQSVTTRDGLFSVLLGSVTPITTGDGRPGTGVEAAYLGMAVAGDAEMAPRLRIAGAAYANPAARTPAGYSPGLGTDNDDEWVHSDSVLYTIRRLGIAKGGASNVFYGSYNYTQTNFGSSCTVGTSGANVGNIAICGGYGNRGSAPFTTVCGGRNNKAGDGATDTSAIVVGGYGNKATEKFSLVIAGQNNTASGVYSTVAGGEDNLASGTEATVAGGTSDTASSANTAVGGGYSNLASGSSATVAGGYDGTASGGYSAVGGGMYNAASNTSTTVGGGYSNTASGLRATVGGGRDNTASGSHSVVPGGYNVSAGADYTLAFGEGLTTTTPRAVVFYHSGGPTKLGVGVQNPTYNVDVAGNGKFAATASGANGVEAYSVYSHAFSTHKPGGHCYYADTGATSYTTFYVEHSPYNAYAVGSTGNDGFWVTSADGRGVYVGNAGEYGVYANSNDARGGYFRNNNNDYYALTAWNNTGTGGTVRGLYVQGHGYATGGWQSYLDGGGRGYGVVSPDMEIMASGTGKLVNGQASVNLEKTFRDAVSSDVPLKVIVTPNSMCNGMCVTNRSASGFSVAELADGASSAGFDWIAIGRLKGGEQRQGAAPVMTDVPPDRNPSGAARR